MRHLTRMTTYASSQHRHGRRDFEDPSILLLYMAGVAFLGIGTAMVYIYSASVAAQ